VAEKDKKLLERARTTAANWSKSDLERLYEAYDFEIVRGTKHEFARHRKYPQLRGTLPNHTSFAPGYVRSAVKLIDEAQRLLLLESKKDEK